MRRKLFINLLLFLLFFTAKAEAKTLEFAHLTDINYKKSESSQLAEFNLQKAIESLNKNNSIEFIAITGNCVEKSKKENILGVSKYFQTLKKPYYIALGNQDAYKAHGLEKEVVMKYFNKISPAIKSNASNYTFKPAKGFLAIVVDGAAPLLQSKHGYFNKVTLKWLDETLEKNRNKKIIILQHFPVIHPYEDYEYTTLNADRYKEILVKYPNIVLVASGHYNLANKMITDSNNIYHISTPTLSTFDGAYNIIKIDYDKKIFKSPEIKTVTKETVFVNPSEDI